MRTPWQHLKRWLIQCGLWVVVLAGCMMWLLPDAHAQQIKELWRAPGGPAASAQVQEWQAMHLKMLAAQNSTVISTSTSTSTSTCTPVTWTGLDPNRPAYAYSVQPGTQLQKPLIYSKDHVASLFWLTGVDAKGCPFVRVSGREVPFTNRDLLSIYPNFELPPLSSRHPLVAIVQTYKSEPPAVLLVESDEFKPAGRRLFIALEIFAAMLTTMLMGALMFWGRNREGLVRAYLGFMAVLTLWLVQSYGLGEAMFSFWPGGQQFVTMQLLGISGLMVGLAVCASLFSGMQAWTRNTYLAVVGAMSGLLMMSPSMSWLGSIAESLVLFYVLITMSVVVKAMLGKTLTDVMYGLGLVVFLAAGLAQLLVQNIAEFGQVDTSLFLPSAAVLMSAIWMLATFKRLQGLRRVKMAQVMRQANTDKLTGLWNRDYIIALMDDLLSKRPPNSAGGMGVYLLDLDNFKIINDTQGHHQGDALLKEVSLRLRQTLSDRVGDQGLVARLGGDEFVIITYNTVSLSTQHLLAQALIFEIAKPMQLGGRPVKVGASMGYVRCNGLYDHGDDLLRDADIAMYEAKKRGRGQVVIFDEAMGAAVQNRANLAAELTQAIKSRELELYFQPIVNISNSHHVGLEALVRWNHPTRGLVSPNDFIPVAEEVGLIVDIGRLVMDMAMQSINQWKRDGLWVPGWYMSVNISGQEISGEGLFEYMESLMSRYGLNGHDLRLELTESAVIKNIDMAKVELPRFMKRGVALCMDDFGTGYSSLSYLNKLPFNVLKIDKSFIDGLEVSSDQKALVRSVLALAQDMNLKVVAEGVEGPGQLALLKTMACDFGQGYLFSKPMSEAQTRRWLRDAVMSLATAVTEDVATLEVPQRTRAIESGLSAAA